MQDQATARELVPRPRPVTGSDAPPDAVRASGADWIGGFALLGGSSGLLALGCALLLHDEAIKGQLQWLLERVNLPFLSHLPWSPWFSLGLCMGSLLLGAVLLFSRLRLTTRVGLATGFWLVLAFALAWAQDSSASYATWLQGRGWFFALVALVPLLLPSRANQNGLVAVTIALAPALTAFVQRSVAAGQLSSPLDALYAVDGMSLLVAWLIHSTLTRSWHALSVAEQQSTLQLKSLKDKSPRLQTWLPARQLFKRDVVVDIARRFPLSEDVQAQFEADQALACALRSGHHAAVWHFGLSTKGEPFSIRERVHGYSFEQLVEKEGPLSPERAIFLLAGACHGVAEAHAAGLPHGALSPWTLWLTQQGSDWDFVKVLHGGLRSLPAPTAEPVTELNMAQGPEAYLAPERVNGKYVASAGSDVYALGCIGYWLLTGRPPFIGKPEAIVRHHAATQAPSLAQLATTQPPQDLEKILRDCLAKDPTERIADAAQLRKRLLGCFAASHWNQARARAWWQANPLPVDASVAKRDPFKFSLRTLFGNED